jgi:Ca2+-binding EF-hand superfamily protein
MKELVKFKIPNALGKAAYSYIASQLVTKEETKKLNKHFKSMDLNNDGYLDKTEIKKAFFDSTSFTLTSKKVDELFDKLDNNNKGKLDYTEFIEGYMLFHKSISDDRIK